MVDMPLPFQKPYAAEQFVMILFEMKFPFVPINRAQEPHMETFPLQSDIVELDTCIVELAFPPTWNA